jgi:L-histidine N-alpha-methyltransferase
MVTGVDVLPVAGDFESDLDRLPPPSGARLVAFLGSTLGNFPPGGRRRFLRSLAGLLRPGDHALLGVDLVKDVDTLEAAYNDAAGVTAEFNRNLLHVLNRELAADFDVALFEHVAFYDPDHEWIEMRLRARRACLVSLAAIDLQVSFRRGEELRTEISAKFTWARLERDLRAAGLSLERWFTDPERRFAVTLARR